MENILNEAELNMQLATENLKQDTQILEQESKSSNA